MLSLKDRLELLKNDLLAQPQRISVYHDLPFAILRYDPQEEWELRCEAKLLATKLANSGKQVHTISLAELLWEAIAEVATALKTLGKPDPWSPDIKASDDFLAPLFKKYFEKLALPNLIPKTNYHVLAKLVPKEKIDPEVIEKLDAIVAVAAKAKPRTA